MKKELNSYPGIEVTLFANDMKKEMKKEIKKAM